MVVHFAIRAEMFLGYVNKYAEIVKYISKRLNMNHKIIKIQKYVFALLFPFMLSACQAEIQVEVPFLNEFSAEMRPKIKMMCEMYVHSSQENGLYFSQTLFDQYKFIGLKNNKYQILKFEKKLYEQSQPAKIILDISGDYSKSGAIINLGQSKQDADFISQDILWIRKNTVEYLVNDYESVARQISWNRQFGSEDGFLKKIDCTEQSYKAYQGEEEQVPVYQELPKQLKKIVLEKPLHTQVQTAQDIKQELLENDDPETPVAQIIEINTPNSSQLFQHQQICIIQGQGKGWSGMIDEPKSPLSSAIIFVYKSETNEKLPPVQKGDMISTSEKECQ